MVEFLTVGKLIEELQKQDKNKAVAIYIQDQVLALPNNVRFVEINNWVQISYFKEVEECTQ